MITSKEFASVMVSNMKIYSEEVNCNRAIPSAIDGLKPVMRKILFWLNENQKKDFMGCAEIVGGVLGTLHPHSDSACYGALVRLSQPLIMQYNLIDFHGNNGGVSIDEAAAMRYTKAKLSNFGRGLLNDLHVPGVVEWTKNYLETIDEPVYLLGNIGSLNLLCNPNTGIGVGTACNFPCHNIEDMKKVLQYRMEHPNCKFEDLPEIYPSYHNNGILINKRDIPNIYKTGKGTIILQMKYHWENNCLITDELPYRVDATQVRKYLIEHQISGIEEVYEHGGQLKIYINSNANKEDILKTLFKKTQLQNAYPVNMTATDLKGKPRLWNLLEILDLHIMLQHRRLTKKAEYEKSKAEHSLHINEGLIKALDIVDEVIAIIRGSDSAASAKIELINKLNIDDEQAKAILDIKLSRLARLEIDSIRQEIENLKLNISYQNEVIESKEKREEIYTNEISIYKDAIKHTETFDLVSLGADGDVVDRDFYLSIQPGKMIASYEPFDSSEKVSLNDNIIVVTTNCRGFKKPMKSVMIGETKWEDFVSLKDGEEMLMANTESEINNYSTFTACINGINYHYSTGILTLGSTARGKKIATGKDIKLSKIELEE